MSKISATMTLQYDTTNDYEYSPTWASVPHAWSVGWTGETITGVHMSATRGHVGTEPTALIIKSTSGNGGEMYK